MTMPVLVTAKRPMVTMSDDLGGQLHAPSERRKVEGTIARGVAGQSVAAARTGLAARRVGAIRTGAGQAVAKAHNGQRATSYG